MVDKDDLFQEEDGSTPQDHDRDEPLTDEDDDIIDLLDTVEMPVQDIEEDIIELEDMVEAPVDEIIELTEETQGPVADDDVLDLTEVVTDEDEPRDDILELTEIADTDDTQDDGVLDLTQKTAGFDLDDEIIDLTEATADDKVFDLLDTAEIPAQNMAEDIIDLEKPAADDEVFDLLDTVEIPAQGMTEDIIDLEEPAADDEVFDLLDTVEIPAQNMTEDIIDLEEPAADDEVFDLLDTIEIPAQGMTEDIIEPADTTQEFAFDADDNDDILSSTETPADSKVFDFLDTIEIPAQDTAEDIIEPADTVQELDFAAENDSLGLTDAVAQDDIDEAALDPDEPDEPVETDQEERFEETIALPSSGYEEDKELLELIDDIQATLNDEPLSARVGDQESTAPTDEVIDTDTLEENADAYTFLNDDDLIEDGGVPESESEFVDHLGIDLTSEIERKALEENQEAVMEDVKPTKDMESGIAPGAVETAVKQALTEMLADENNPLAKAIENAVRKALGQGEDT